MNGMKNGLTHEEEDKLCFDQNILGQFMALDALKDQQPEVFKADIGDPENYDIYSTGDVRQAEISCVQAHQNHEILSEGLQQNNSKNARKDVVLAEIYASKIQSIVFSIEESERQLQSLKNLDEIEQITNSYDLPKGFEIYKKKALDHISKARYQLMNKPQDGFDYPFEYEDTDQFKAEQAMEMIESELGRYEEMEQENFEGYYSEDIQEYAEYQLDIAQERLFDDSISDEDALEGLDNALKAIQALPAALKEEEAQSAQEDQEEEDNIWKEAGNYLSENQLYMCDVVHEDYPELDLTCIKLMYEDHLEDFDAFEEMVSDFSRYLKHNTGEQRKLFTSFRAEEFLKSEDYIGEIPLEEDNLVDLE